MIEKEVIKRIAKVEADLLAQEHRMVKVASNLLEHGFDASNPDKRKASWSAIFSFLFRQAKITLFIAISSGLVALSSLYLAWKSNNIIKKQNTLISIQNERVREQTYLMDSGMKKPARSEVIELEKLIDANLTNDGELPLEAIAELSSRLFVFKPYHYLDDQKDQLNEFPYSQEKSRILLKTLEVSINEESWRNIARGINFNRVDISNMIFPDASDFSEFELNGSKFHNSTFRYCSFESAKLNVTNFSEVNFLNVIFKSAFVPNCDFTDATFNNVDFSGAALNSSVFANVDLYSSTLDSAILSNVDFRGADIYNISAIGADFHDAMAYESQRLSFKLSGLTEEQLSQFVWYEDQEE